MPSYSFRLVALTGRFADHIALPISSQHQKQDFLVVTVSSGATPAAAAQEVFARHGVTVGDQAITVLATTDIQGLVVVAALPEEALDRMASTNGFQLQPTAAALNRTWTLGNAAEDFFLILAKARMAYEHLQKGARVPALLAA